MNQSQSDPMSDLNCVIRVVLSSAYVIEPYVLFNFLRFSFRQRLFRKFHHRKVQEAEFKKHRPLPHARPLLDAPAADVPHGVRITVHAKHKLHNEAQLKVSTALLLILIKRYTQRLIICNLI